MQSTRDRLLDAAADAVVLRRRGVPALGRAVGVLQLFQSLLSSRIVPWVRDTGLWGEKVQKAPADRGVLDLAGVDLAELMRQDEDVVEAIDTEKRELLVRQREVEPTIALAEAPVPERPLAR